MAKDWKIIKLAFLTAIASIGGWSVFSGVTSIFPLNTFNPLVRIIFGLGLIWLLYKLGIQKE